MRIYIFIDLWTNIVNFPKENVKQLCCHSHHFCCIARSYSSTKQYAGQLSLAELRALSPDVGFKTIATMPRSTVQRAPASSRSPMICH